MQFRQIGRTELKVSPLCFGGNVFGWTADESTSFALLDQFVDAGLNYVDTADVYSVWADGNEGGESETILGNWIKARGARDKIVLATKLGSKMGADGDGLAMPGGLGKAYIREAVEASLRRLQTDYVDLYQAHFPDPTTPLEDSLAVFDALIKEGKVRHIGCSNHSSAGLTAALAISNSLGLPRFESLQTHYNLYNRHAYEAALEQVCVANDVSVISYFSLESGFLTGKYRSEADFSKSARGGWMGQYFNPRGFRILDALEDVAAARKATPARIALAWLLARPSITATATSATRADQLSELIASTTITLSPDDIAVLNAASAES